MRTKLTVVLPALALLAACGGPQDGLVSFYGVTPNTAIDQQNETRKVALACPKCKGPVSMDDETCPKGPKLCETQIQWKDKYDCRYCEGSGKCQACFNMEQQAGNCYNCAGSGYRVYIGKTVDCPNCKSTGKCPVCEGKNECDKCYGETKLSRNQIEDLAGTSSSSEDTADESEN